MVSGWISILFFLKSITSCLVFVVLNRLLTLHPYRQLLHLVPVCQLLLLTRDEPDYCGVVSKLYNPVAGVGEDAVLCVEGVEKAGRPVLRLRTVEVWGHSLTLWKWPDRRFRI